MSTQAFARKNDPQTSWDAARSVTDVEKTRYVLLSILRRFGPLTDERLADEYREVWRRWGAVPKSSPSGLRTRRNELVEAGKVEAYGTGKTASGRNCTLWRAIPEKGQTELL